LQSPVMNIRVRNHLSRIRPIAEEIITYEKVHVVLICGG
jgi:hypothetical protein